MTTTQLALTPLERLQVREALQDHWREQVYRITDLSLSLHTSPDRDDDRDVDLVAVATALGGARLKLSEIEAAMRRLDDRSYGTCLACFSQIPYGLLIDEPARRDCRDCRDALRPGRRAAAVAHAG